jgi:hypothetical protein
MLALATFAVTIAFWPGWPEPGEAVRWLVIAGVLPVLLAARPPVVGWPGWCVVGWVAFCFLSAAWSPSPWATFGAAMQAALLAGAFMAGTAWTASAGPLVAFAAATAVSCLLAVAQAAGWDGLPQSEAPGGLFANRNYLAEAATAAAIAALLLRRWTLLGLAATGLALAGSKAPAVALALAAAWLLWPHRRRWSLAALGALAVAGVTVALWLPGSLEARLALWGPALANLEILGHGLGATWAAFPSWGAPWSAGVYAAHIGPSHLHNELLAAVSDTGVAALLLLPALLAALRGGRHDPVCGAVLVGLLGLGLVGMPFANPATGFLACLVAGRLCRLDAELGRAVGRFGERAHGERAGGDLVGGRAAGDPGADPGALGSPAPGVDGRADRHGPGDRRHDAPAAAAAGAGR